MKKLWVISLGGSRIVPGEVDDEFIVRFKKVVDSHPSIKFVVVTGGGSTARKYIKALKKLGKKTKQQSLIGIAITRLHASFLARLFGEKANEIIPKNMRKVKNLLRKNQIVFCGGLRYKEKNTSDATAAKLSAYLKSPFINLTNVNGLYSSDPRKNPKAKLIKRISWKKFNEIAKRIKFSAGQHFVLDQSAARIIMKNKIPTYIIGKVKEIEKIIKGKKFEGTLING